MVFLWPWTATLAGSDWILMLFGGFVMVWS